MAISEETRRPIKEKCPTRNINVPNVLRSSIGDVTTCRVGPDVTRIHSLAPHDFIHGRVGSQNPPTPNPEEPKKRATSLAATIQEQLDIVAVLEVGEGGQFDVLADGKVIASRGGNVFARVLGGGWPKPDEVVAALRAHR